MGLGSKNGKKLPVYAVDSHTGDERLRKIHGNINTLPEFRSNLSKAGVDDVVVTIVALSADVAGTFVEPIELLFVDAGHEYEKVKQDFDLWYPKVISGGIMAFHDATCWPGPMAVAEESILHSERFTEVGTVDSIVYAKKV